MVFRLRLEGVVGGGVCVGGGSKKSPYKDRNTCECVCDSLRAVEADLPCPRDVMCLDHLTHFPPPRFPLLHRQPGFALLNLSLIKEAA